jgi:hypothetical protein
VEWRDNNCNKSPRLVKREVPRMAVLFVSFGLSMTRC